MLLNPIPYPQHSPIHAIPYFSVEIICGPHQGLFPVRDICGTVHLSKDPENEACSRKLHDIHFCVLFIFEQICERNMFSKRLVLSQRGCRAAFFGLQNVQRGFAASSGIVLCFFLRINSGEPICFAQTGWRSAKRARPLGVRQSQFLTRSNVLEEHCWQRWV